MFVIHSVYLHGGGRGHVLILFTSFSPPQPSSISWSRSHLRKICPPSPFPIVLLLFCAWIYLYVGFLTREEPGDRSACMQILMQCQSKYQLHSSQSWRKQFSDLHGTSFPDWAPIREGAPHPVSRWRLPPLSRSDPASHLPSVGPVCLLWGTNEGSGKVMSTRDTEDGVLHSLSLQSALKSSIYRHNYPMYTPWCDHT